MILSAQTAFSRSAAATFSRSTARFTRCSPLRVTSPSRFDAILTEAVENLNICLSSPFHTGRETEFLETKDAFVRLYMQCQTAFAPSDRATPADGASCLILSATS